VCVRFLMYSVASVCEIYTVDINMGVGWRFGLDVCLLIGFVVLVRQRSGSTGQGSGDPSFVWSREIYSSNKQQGRDVQIG
jgi:hypothetical protein